MLKLKFSLICLPILALFLCSCDKKEEKCFFRKEPVAGDYFTKTILKYNTSSNLTDLIESSNRLETLRWIEDTLDNPICTSAILSRDQDEYTLNCECIAPKEISDENGMELTFIYKDLSIAVPLQEQSGIFFKAKNLFFVTLSRYGILLGIKNCSKN